MTRADRKRRELLMGLLVLLIVCVLAFVCLEIGVRMWWKPAYLYGYPAGLQVPDEKLGYRYAANFSGHFTGGDEYTKILLTTNAQGLRDSEHAYLRTNKQRVLALGDSVTMGAGVAWEDVYVTRLEQNIPNLEIVNAGVNGYEFSQEVDYFMLEGHLYSPDVVLVGVVLNDAYVPNIGDLATHKASTPLSTKIFRFLVTHVKSLRFVNTKIKNIIYKARGADYNTLYFSQIYEQWDTEWELYEQNLLRLSSAVKERNATLALIIFPYTHQFSHSADYGDAPQKKIVAFAKNHDIPVLDLLPALDQQGFETYYLPADSVHLNDQGHELVAQTVQPWLERILSENN